MRIYIKVTPQQYRVLQQKHKEGISGFIVAALHTRFGKTIPICESPKRQKKITKEYNLCNLLPDEIKKAVICESSQMGITPSQYILRFIISKELDN